MPEITIFTNVSSKKVPAGFMKEATDLVAKQLEKPAEYVCVRVHTDQNMTFGGTAEPCAAVDLYSIGQIGPDKNEGYTAAIHKFVESKLKIASNRCYVFYHDLDKSNVGWNGKTFGTWLK